LRKVAFILLAIPLIAMNFGGVKHAFAEESSTTVPYACDANIPLLGEIKLNMDVKITANVPESVESLAAFTIEESYSEVIFGAEYVPILDLAFNPIKGTVQSFYLELDNATTPEGETSINVAEGGLEIPETPFNPEAESVSFRVPAEGGIDLELVAGESGEVVIYAGEIVTILNGNLGGLPLDIEATCVPGSYDGSEFVETDPTLNVIPIEEDEEDTEAPIITLHGDNPMYLYVGDAYEEPGYEAFDNVDGDLTDEVVVTGDVDTSTPGDYTLVYTVTDSSGNEGRAERHVIVQERPDEEPPVPGGTWYYGEGEPDPDLGKVGDLYLDISNGDVYVKEENG